MPTPNQVDALQRLTSQYQIPSGTRRSSLSQTPVQSQSQTVGIHGSSSQAQANGAGNAYQNLQRVVYKPQAGEGFNKLFPAILLKFRSAASRYLKSHGSLGSTEIPIHTTECSEFVLW